MNGLHRPRAAAPGAAPSVSSPRPGAGVPVVLLVLAVLALRPGAAVAGPAPAPAPTQLVIPAARDTTLGFVAVTLPDGGGTVLAWPEGLVVAEKDVPWLADGPRGLAFPLEGPLRGAGAGGVFSIRAGRFSIDTPLYLVAGGVQAYLQAGELTVTAGRVVYRRPAVARDPRGDYLLLAGLVVATGILLHLARRRRSAA